MREAADLISDSRWSEGRMYTVTVSDPIARCALPRSPAPETIERGAPRSELRPLAPDLATDEGATLLVAALEEIESRRAALEWLLENDLLHQCLV